jgi:hypothetical protein
LLKGNESAKPYSGLWQDAQLTLESEERIGSKNNWRPKEILVQVWFGFKCTGLPGNADVNVQKAIPHRNRLRIVL